MRDRRHSWSRRLSKSTIQCFSFLSLSFSLPAFQLIHADVMFTSQVDSLHETESDEEKKTECGREIYKTFELIKTKARQKDTSRERVTSRAQSRLVGVPVI